MIKAKIYFLSFLIYYFFFLLQGLTVVNISATTFPQTLDWLHSYLLQVWASYSLMVLIGSPEDRKAAVIFLTNAACFTSALNKGYLQFIPPSNKPRAKMGRAFWQCTWYVVARSYTIWVRPICMLCLWLENMTLTYFFLLEKIGCVLSKEVPWFYRDKHKGTSVLIQPAITE